MKVSLWVIATFIFIYGHRSPRRRALEIVTKQLQLLKETVPKAHRVAILSNPANAYHQLAIRK